MDNTIELLNDVYINRTNFACGVTENCPYMERSLSYALKVDIPEDGIDPDAVFKECCYNHLVLADANTNKDFKNDYSSFYHQRQIPNETVDFFLYHVESDTEFPMNDGTYGDFFGFGFFETNIDLKGYLVKWKNVLTEIGEGNFKVIKRQTIAGINIETNSITFTLKQYGSLVADKTVRVDVVMDGRLVKSNIDFTGTGWKHSIRVPGFFGRREPQFEEDNLVDRSLENRQISLKQSNEYKFQTNLIPDCITNEIIDFHFMSNKIFMNDYNLNNHSYKFVKFAVKIESNDGTKYGTKTRKAGLNFTFSDKKVNNIKRNYS